MAWVYQAAYFDSSREVDMTGGVMFGDPGGPAKEGPVELLKARTRSLAVLWIDS
jgi:hypothetical protein